MKIAIEKFGNILVSRPSGKEAFLALNPMLKDLGTTENLELDFSGVIVLTPSWADEFVTPLKSQFPGRVSLVNTENSSITATLKTLENSK